MCFIENNLCSKQKFSRRSILMLLFSFFLACGDKATETAEPTTEPSQPSSEPSQPTEEPAQPSSEPSSEENPTHEELCENWCELTESNCSEYAIHPHESCLDFCNHELQSTADGTSADTSENTLYCRINHANDAENATGIDREQSCEAASFNGGGVCGSTCANYCDTSGYDL